MKTMIEKRISKRVNIRLGLIPAILIGLHTNKDYTSRDITLALGFISITFIIYDKIKNKNVL